MIEPSPLILVLEDEPLIQDMVQDVLSKAGLRTIICDTGAEGLRRFEAEKPDLVILDVTLKDGEGFSLCEKLGLGKTVDTPFLFLSAREELSVRLKAFELGAHDYVVKPFSGAELLARVKVHLKIKKLYDELSRRAYDLELLNKTRQDVMEMIVHDLKSPITAISGTLSIIKMRGLITDQAYSRLIDSADSASDFLLLMVNDLLDIGRAETAGLKPEAGRVDVEELYGRVRKLFIPRHDAKGISLAARKGEGLEAVGTDGNLMFRVLVNLVSNATKFTTKGQQVEIELEREGGTLRWKVLDRGPGVSAELKKSIFNKYSTKRSAGSLSDGTGIGLTFCRLACEALGGGIRVEDRPGGGACFVAETRETPL